MNKNEYLGETNHHRSPRGDYRDFIEETNTERLKDYKYFNLPSIDVAYSFDDKSASIIKDETFHHIEHQISKTFPNYMVFEYMIGIEYLELLSCHYNSGGAALMSLPLSWYENGSFYNKNIYDNNIFFIGGWKEYFNIKEVQLYIKRFNIDIDKYFSVEA